VEFTVPPGRNVNADTPFDTPAGPVSDVDYIDKNGDGIVDQTPGLWGLLFGEKYPGTDTGILGTFGECVATDPLGSEDGDPSSPSGPPFNVIIVP
jgi:hypothetical protein